MTAVAPQLGQVTNFVDLAGDDLEPSWSTKLLSAWKPLQLSYFGGKYSIHRAIALDEYNNKTSLVHVVMVCIGTPLPMVALVFAQESIPLQDPCDGWRVSYGLWIRAAILVCVVIQALMLQATYLIEGFTIFMGQLFLLYVIVSGGVVALAMLVAEYLVFPIPFFILAMLLPFYLVLSVTFRFILGASAIRLLLSKRDLVIRFAIMIASQTTPAVIYPVYEMLFRRSEGTHYQLPVILLLPVIKVTVKNIVLRCSVDLEDMVPETVIFTVDYFNAIYIATCMQSASSVAAVSTMIMTDLLQTIVMLYGLQRRTIDCVSTFHQAVGPQGLEKKNCNCKSATIVLL